ncbi:uncharacterized protein LOC133917964 [Phragmites australis]|uniref:uncharacterized protein LOC133917964 n=1 Tax=Phragmites australis TaxID=29695 RepID=UPI002D7912D6|nr:uncharacterized protein LOC133917964 [Phragmites australis]
MEVSLTGCQLIRVGPRLLTCIVRDAARRIDPPPPAHPSSSTRPRRWAGCSRWDHPRARARRPVSPSSSSWCRFSSRQSRQLAAARGTGGGALEDVRAKEASARERRRRRAGGEATRSSAATAVARAIEGDGVREGRHAIARRRRGRIQHPRRRSREKAAARGRGGVALEPIVGEVGYGIYGPRLSMQLSYIFPHNIPSSRNKP